MTERGTTKQRPSEPLPESVTLPLLTLISRQALDEDYVRAAEQRQLRGISNAPRRRYTAAAAVLVFGMLASTAAIQSSRDVKVNDAGRATLISRITGERERVSELQDRVVDLRQSNARRTAVLADLVDSAEVTSNQLRRMRVRTGFVPVTGEGVRVTLSNAPEADPNQVVYDSDLALLVNGLWSAGAEAIAVNGQRLTAMTAIRNSGVPIEVNRVGIAPPYVVSVIGDRRSLQANFFDTSSGLAFADLARRLGFSYAFSNEAVVTMPSGPARNLRLRNARLLPGFAANGGGNIP